MWGKFILNLPGVARDTLGAHNEYTIGKSLRQNLGSVNVLIPTLTKALGAHHAQALVSSFALPTGVAMLGLIVLQGRDASEKLGRIHDTLNAQTALMSAKMFSVVVWNYLQQRIDETRNKARGASHWFFIYHPDTNWHPAFHTLGKRNGKPKRLIGISHNLPQLCCFMMHIRTYLQGIGSKKPIVFHLLMPAYQYMYIDEKLAFNPSLYPLVLEGHIYGSYPLVTLRVINKIEDGAFKMRDIKNRPDDAPTLWNLWNLFASEPPTLKLGRIDIDDDSDEGDVYSDTDSSEYSSSMSQTGSTRRGLTASTRIRRETGKVTRESRMYIKASHGRSGWVRHRPRHDVKT